MFQFNFRVVRREDDDFDGKNGFVELVFNEFKYGIIWPEEKEEFMERDYLYNWVVWMCKVAAALKDNDYVALNDIETMYIWLDFKRVNDIIRVRKIEADKWNGSRPVELKTGDIHRIIWSTEGINYAEFINIIKGVASEFLDYLIENNRNNETFINGRYAQKLETAVHSIE